MEESHGTPILWGGQKISSCPRAGPPCRPQRSLGLCRAAPAPGTMGMGHNTPPLVLHAARPTQLSQEMAPPEEARLGATHLGPTRRGWSLSGARHPWDFPISPPCTGMGEIWELYMLRTEGTQFKCYLACLTSGDLYLDVLYFVLILYWKTGKKINCLGIGIMSYNCRLAIKHNKVRAFLLFPCLTKAFMVMELVSKVGQW